MTAREGKRNDWLYWVLAITLGLTAWMAMHKQDDTSSEDLLTENKATTHPSRQITHRPARDNLPRAANMASEEVQVYQRSLKKREIKDLFNVHSWYVPPPVKKILPPPPPAPTAPPVPFVYVGKLEDSPGVSSIFLLGGNRLHAIKQGENLNAEWRLDAESEQALSFTYLPLGLPQTLSKAMRVNSVEAPVEAQNIQ